MEVLSQSQGLMLIIGYFAAMMLIVFCLKKHKEDKAEFLVAGRNAPWIATAFSLAATWVWAPSMFTAAEKAYTQGLAGVFWFVVPNVATLILFAYYAKRLRRVCKEGWTFSGYIHDKFSNRTQNLFLAESVVLQVSAIAIQLLAAGAIFAKITGLNFFLTTILIGIIPLLHTLRHGLRSSIITDLIKMSIIVVVLLMGVPILLHNAPVDVIAKGIGGVTGDFGNLFSKSGIDVFLSFGIPSTLVLLSGTFGDQMFWQRAFALKESNVKKTMILAAVIFAVVPVSLSLFGFIAAGAGIDVADTQLTNVTSIVAFAPKWFLYCFFILILSGLISTVDSVLCAISSVAGHDFFNKIFGNPDRAMQVRNNPVLNALFGNEVRIGRTAMVAISLLAVGMANLPGLTITYLWLVYGTMRSGVLLPTMFAIKQYKISERGMYYGLIISWLVGLPLFAYANLVGNTPLIVTGSLITIGASGILCLAMKDRKPIKTIN